jgi:hypothetical protein
MGDETLPDEATRDAERAEAAQAHIADRPPTSEEEAAADRALETFGDDRDEVKKNYEEMNEIGAKVKGEGAIE